MNESRIDATDRLRREGRWAEAWAYREELRRSLRAEKTPRAKANEDSWAAMLAKYPPLARSNQLAPDTEGEAQSAADNAVIAAIIGRDVNGEPDVVHDILWVYDHLFCDEVDLQGVPSLGAWSLWRWARDNRNHFIERLVPRAMALRPRQEVEDEMQREEQLRIEDLERELGVDVAATWEPCADPRGKIRESTLSTLSDLERRFGLSLPGGAADALAGRMVELAGKHRVGMGDGK